MAELHINEQVHQVDPQPIYKEENKKCYRILELYSGIGGMRYALKALNLPFEIIAAIDVNPIVNAIYQHNFKESGYAPRNILSFTIEEIECMNLDMITMSPPCQPFTRIGLKKDVNDSRSSSFLHVLGLLSKLQKKPRYLFLENVQGFEVSEARNQLIETIKSCGYRYQEFLLSPRDVGVPNSRQRYYLLAKLRTHNFYFTDSDQVLKQIPNRVSSSICETDMKKFCLICCTENADKCILKHYLENKPSEYFLPFLVPDDILLKHWAVFDIVTDQCATSCCFTKAYGRYVTGTGSVLSFLEDTKLPRIFDKVASIEDRFEKLTVLKELKLRYFTPKEIANLMCFPKSFAFPENLNTRQLYKALGNSLNVFVVSSLMKILFEEGPS